MENPTDSDPNSLTIVERPYVLWLFGAVFAGFGVVFMFATDAPRLMGAIFALIGGIVLVMTPVAAVTIDRAAGSLILRNRSLVGQRFEEIPIGELQTIKLQYGRSGRGGACRIGFVLRDGSEVPMTGYYSSGRKGKERQIEQMRAFLGLRVDPG